jgi:hypothetical protein
VHANVGDFLATPLDKPATQRAPVVIHMFVEASSTSAVENHNKPIYFLEKIVRNRVAIFSPHRLTALLRKSRRRLSTRLYDSDPQAMWTSTMLQIHLLTTAGQNLANSLYAAPHNTLICLSTRLCEGSSTPCVDNRLRCAARGQHAIKD